VKTNNLWWEGSVRKKTAKLYFAYFFSLEWSSGRDETLHANRGKSV